jgi:hypothetical protein
MPRTAARYALSAIAAAVLVSWFSGYPALSDPTDDRMLTRPDQELTTKQPAAQPEGLTTKQSTPGAASGSEDAKSNTVDQEAKPDLKPIQLHKQ